jgi:hypothetical protein
MLVSIASNCDLNKLFQSKIKLCRVQTSTTIQIISIFLYLFYSPQFTDFKSQVIHFSNEYMNFEKKDFWAKIFFKIK